MANKKLPTSDQVSDKQVVQVAGPDGIVSGFQYNKETNSYYIKDKQIIIPTFHGQTHVGTDPIPSATTLTPGLMSANDKAKLDALTPMELGVLGFMGAGFADDGGFMKGRIILAGGSEFISLERIGNVIRFTVDSPIPFNCGIEECANIFWIQDETDTASIRPPSCAGKLPGANVYGEMKIYLMPESTIVNSANPATTLNKKGSYPSFIFKRYDNSITPGLANIEAVLERNEDLTTKTGWAMTPGSTGKAECVWFMGHDNDGRTVSFALNRNLEPGLLGTLLYNGHSITRQKAVVTGYTSGILASNIYVCRFWNVDGAAPVGDEFQAVNAWKYNNPENTEADVSAPKALVTDATADLLPIGTLVDIWEFLISTTTDPDTPIVRRYFSQRPDLNPENLWALAAAVAFGDRITMRDEVTPGGNLTELTGENPGVSAPRIFERDEWGLTGFEDPLYLADDGESTSTESYTGTVTDIGAENPLLPSPNVELTIDGDPHVFNAYIRDTAMFPELTGINAREFTVLSNTTTTVTIRGIGPEELTAAVADAGGLPVTINLFNEVATSVPSGVPINNRFIASIDYERPGLAISQLPPLEDREQPVFLWHRGNYDGVYLKAKVGQPDSSHFPPIDILLRAPIDSYDEVYMQVVSRGTIASGAWVGRKYIRVTGTESSKLPAIGTLRTLSGIYRDQIWKYVYKVPFGSPASGTSILLIGEVDVPYMFDDDYIAGDDGNPSSEEVATSPTKTTVVELLHNDYTSPCVRIEFSVDNDSAAEAVQLQFKAGILDMGEQYELNLNLPEDNYVRGMRPGDYAVSKIYTQDGFIRTGAETPAADPSTFRCYYGGYVGDVGGSELWNDLEILYKNNQVWIWWNGLLVPPDATASAALPTPVAVNTPYFLVDSDLPLGKVGFRLWPGAIVRNIEIRNSLNGFSEYSHGQLEVTDGTGSA